MTVGKMLAFVDGAGASAKWGLIVPPDGTNGCSGSSCGNPNNFNAFWAGTALGVCGGGNSQGDSRPGNVAKFAQDRDQRPL